MLYKKQYLKRITLASLASLASLLLAGPPPAAHVARLALVGGVVGADDGPALRPRHIRRLVALVALHDVELDALLLAHALLVLVGVVARDGALVDEDVLVRVVAVDEAVAVLHVEPLHYARYFRDCKQTEEQRVRFRLDDQSGI